MECRITQLGNMEMPEFGRILNRRAAGSIHLGKFSKWPTIPIEIPLQKGMDGEKLQGNKNLLRARVRNQSQVGKGGEGGAT